MNAIQMRERIDQYVDRTRTARHEDISYYNAINAAINMILKDRLEPIRLRRKYSVQRTQRIRDELYTLVSTTTPTLMVANNLVPFPADYYYFLQLDITISSVIYSASITSYNELGPLKENPFMKPSAVKPYFVETATDLRVYWDDSGLLTYELIYIKQPALVSIGEERDKISTVVALTAATVYYVYEDATYAATVTTGTGAVVTSGQVLAAGETFTATGANLLTGIVINTAKVVNSDFPVNMHEEICKQAAEIMEGTVEQFAKKQALAVDVEKS